jgi:hypothetical protein
LGASRPRISLRVRAALTRTGNTCGSRTRTTCGSGTGKTSGSRTGTTCGSGTGIACEIRTFKACRIRVSFRGGGAGGPVRTVTPLAGRLVPPERGLAFRA